MESFPDDILPPEGTYESRAALLTAIQAWAKPRGYAFVTGTSRKQSGRLKVVFACDRYGRIPQSTTERTRHTASRKTGCKFSVLAKESRDGTWILSHRPDQAYAQHNHGPSPQAATHPAHRRPQDTEIAAISNLMAAGSRPQEIRTYLSNNPASEGAGETLLTQQDVYNQLKIIRRDLRQGQSSIDLALPAEAAPPPEASQRSGSLLHLSWWR